MFLILFSNRRGMLAEMKKYRIFERKYKQVVMISLKDFFSFRHNRSFWMNIIGMVVVVIATVWGILWGLDVYTRHGNAVVVPDVKGTLLNEAALHVSRQQLKVAVVDSNYVKGLEPNTVLDQHPAGGMKVKQGRIVYLTINSASEPLITVPDVVNNSSYRQAEARLKALGFRLTEPKLIAGERDWVYGLKMGTHALAAGNKISSESVLTLEIGNGLDYVPEDSLANDSVKRKLDMDDSWF